MSGEIIDLKTALEERQFKAKEDHLKKIREAFRAARLAAQGQKKIKSTATSKVKHKKKTRKNKH